MLNAVLGIFALIIGTLLMILSSDKAVKHSVIFASTSRIPSIMIGLVLVSMGTDMPEIVNSVMSSMLGYGDINAGNAIGSVLAQMTIVLGLIPLLGRSFKVKRKEILITGSCVILALMLVTSIMEKGYITRINAFILVLSWPIYMLITKFMAGKGAEREVSLINTERSQLYHILVSSLSFIGVAVGAYTVIESAIIISEAFNVSEFLTSFFVMSIGTSLPELAVSLVAIRKREYEIVIGDIIGSCIIDASFAVGIGPMFFPQKVSGDLAGITILYTMLASLIVIAVLAVRERVDKGSGVLFILVYLLSYMLLTV